MQWLKKITLSTKHLNWVPDEIISIARGNPHVNMLAVDSDYGNDDMKFGTKYKKTFADLIKERKKLTIKVFFHQGKREINISEKGFSEKHGNDENGNANPFHANESDGSMMHLIKCIQQSLKQSERQMEQAFSKQ